MLKSFENLPEDVRAVGIVPQGEKTYVNFFLDASRIRLDIVEYRRLNRFRPLYSPSVYGVSGDGTIYFIFPGVPEGNTIFTEYFDKFLGKAYPLIYTSK